MAFIFLMNNRKLTVCFSGIAKESEQISAVVKTVSKAYLHLLVSIFRINMIMQAGAIILLTGLKPWIANKRAAEEHLII
jgi:hypothetical protein